VERKRLRLGNPVATALYVNAAILLAILLALLRRPAAPDFLPAALGQMQTPIAGGNGLYVMPAQFHSQVWGCYVLDTDADTLCTYEYDSGQRQLKLTSARSLRYDRQLKDFATYPAPWEVEQMVEQEKQDERARAQKAAPAPNNQNQGNENPVQAPQ
jgi:hypothetical protein